MASLVGSLIEVTRFEGDPALQKLERVSARYIVDGVVQGRELEADARRCRIVARNHTTRTLLGHRELLWRAIENVPSATNRQRGAGDLFFDVMTVSPC